MVERQLPKLHTRVRFPSPAPDFQPLTSSLVGSAPAAVARAYPFVSKHLLGRPTNFRLGDLRPLRSVGVEQAGDRH
jgi:hypothetical protein